MKRKRAAAVEISAIASAVGIGLGFAQPASAIPLVELWARGAEITIESWTGTLTQNEEDVANVQLLNERRAELHLPPLPVPPLLGQANINGQPTMQLSFSPQSASLTFSVLDIATGIAQSPSSLGIASVRYEYSTNMFVGPLTWNLAGSGTNSANGFLFTWNTGGFWEPMVRAIPLDAQGNEIILISGQTNDNALIGTALSSMSRPVPEPSSMALIFAATGMLAGLIARRPRRT
jgi:hypothetical protein